ncbi:MAG: NAD-dependent epimerase/dehydratase family protein [Acidimicrobiia bacterium]|nr:NAD-dependent epimerase/dehydratase family protein [Acidimicrobiia bacterium]
MKALVTGATGYVGGAVFDHLVAAGHDVAATVRSEPAGADIRSRGGRPVEASLEDLAALVDAMEGSDVVFHVAGVNEFCLPDPAGMFAANVGGSANVIRAALRAGVGKVVYTSSAVTIGEPAGAVGDESMVHRGWYLSQYERSKVEAERAVAVEAEDLGVNVVSVNPASVQGPGRVTGTARLLLAFLKGRLRYLPDTRATIVDVDDCARGHVAAAEHGAKGARYLLAGATVSTGDMATQLASAAGLDIRSRSLPPQVARIAGAFVGGAYRVARRQPPICPEMIRTMLHGHAFDGSRAERELGITYTPLADTFERMVAWYRLEGLL